MLGLIAASFGMVFALVGDVVASRMGAGRVTSYGASLLAGFCATILLLLVLQGSDGPTAMIAMLAYGAWWFAFLNLVQSLESSLRVKILGAMRASGDRISLTELARQYNDRILLGLRLERLRASGAVSEIGGRLRVESRGLKAIASFFRVLKMLLVGKTSEFGAPVQ